jgi:tRNA pseudouridine55 synthase
MEALETPQKAPEMLLIDKPLGMTSYDAIRVLKRRFRGVKIGHAGTLDPNATGLMIIGLGTGTKKLTEFLKLPKSYEAGILFGVQTDSGDITGKIIGEKDASLLTEEILHEAIKKIIGTHSFAVPKYSAIKVAGERLYARARKGEDFTPPSKEMTTYTAHIENIKQKESRMRVDITFDVASGTYIRTLAEELGKFLGLPATLETLRRTRIGDFHIEDAEKI